MGRMADICKCFRCKTTFDPYEHNQVDGEFYCPSCFCKDTEFVEWVEVDEEDVEEERDTL